MINLFDTQYLFGGMCQDKRRIRRMNQMMFALSKAITASQKREIIELVNPNYYLFGNKLDPRNPYEVNENE